MNAKSLIGPAWFCIAVQALMVIAERDGACPSGAIAHDLNAHAVFLRRVLAQLARAGIVEAHEGRDGGYQLKRSPEQILLSEVYQATKAANQAEEHECTHNTSPQTKMTLEKVRQEVDLSTLEVLSHYSIASLLQQKDTPSKKRLLL